MRRAKKGVAAWQAGRAARWTRGRPRLGVLSGTFNPPTRAHLAMAEQAAEQLALDEVLFVLPEVPPHKRRLEASLEDRAEMLRRAIARKTNFSAAIASHGLFLDIHRALEREYPAGTRVFFLAGRDAAERILLRWPYADPEQALAQMFARFELVVAERGGRFVVPGGSVAAPYARKIHSLVMPPGTESVSATRARECLASGNAVADLLPRSVAAYITERALYRAAKKRPRKPLH